jgi:hypothetical protein
MLSNNTSLNLTQLSHISGFHPINAKLSFQVAYKGRKNLPQVEIDKEKTEDAP